MIRKTLWALCLGLFGLTVVAPIVAMLWQGIGGERSSVQARHALALLVDTATWSVAVSVGALLLGWPAGRALDRLVGRRSYAALAALLVVPICMPAYVVFYAWWQSWPADSALYAWAVQNQSIPKLRALTLYCGLVCWSWPIAAWCIAGSSLLGAGREQELLAVDAASWWQRLGSQIRADVGGLILGFTVIFLVTFNNTTSFDLAGVRSLGNELRIVADGGGSSADVVVAAWPSMVLSVLLVAGVWWKLSRSPESDGVSKQRKLPPRLVLTVLVIWVVSVLGPLGLFLRGWDPQTLPAFWRLYGSGFLRSLGVAAAAAGLGAMLAVWLSLLWQDRRPWVRWVAHAMTVGWMVMAVLPATLVAVGLEAAYNLSWPSWGRGASQTGENGLGSPSGQSHITLASLMYRRSGILVMGYLARFGFLAALVGRWLACQEPRSLAELRRVDGAERLPDVGQAWGPRLRIGLVALVGVSMVLVLGEVAVTARLQPPGFDATAGSILNALHYQRPDVVVTALLLFAAAAVVIVTLVMVWWLVAWGRMTGGTLALCLLVFGGVCSLGGCQPTDEAGGVVPKLTFGGRGELPGEFVYPRGIAVDSERRRVYVVDKTARVQQFDFDGTCVGGWQMPEMDLGKPTGLNVAPDGIVWVADTHYFRIVAYDASGVELVRFGSYGEDPGEFIYPTDVAFGPDGLLYVSEYGGNDRVQVFTAEGELVFGFGSFGPDVGQYSRPQSMSFNSDRTELFIADACNHRIVVVDPSGEVLRHFGTSGRELGQLLYPYDLAVLDDGTLLVCEFGNNRIQRFSQDGQWLGVWGGPGSQPGQLKYPWGVDAGDDRVFVLDSGNDRIQVIGVGDARPREDTRMLGQVSTGSINVPGGPKWMGSR